MGVYGLWQLIKDKKYVPQLHHNRLPPGTTYRVDLMGSFFSTIQNAYSRHPPEVAHQMIERKLESLGDRKDLCVYIDGMPALEKEETHRDRDKSRQKSKETAIELMDKMRQRIFRFQRGTRQQFKELSKHVRHSFTWSYTLRIDLARYLREKSWPNVVVASTEADLSIATSCMPEDVVVTRDSDLLVYATVNKLFRPVSKDSYLLYDIKEVCTALNLPSRQHLSALGVICRNDYQRNIKSLGPSTNLKIIKQLQCGGKSLCGIRCRIVELFLTTDTHRVPYRHRCIKHCRGVLP